MAAQGLLYIVSAPSGGGKTSLVKRLLGSDPHLKLSISHTTRPPRAGEESGKEYHFVDLTEFESLKQQGFFIETAEVFGHWYGTSKPALEAVLSSGIDLILEIDWQGARAIRALFPCVSIFILPPTKAVLLERLKTRATDAQEVIANRMEKSVHEMEHYGEYDYIVVNDNFEKALGDLTAIIRAGRLGTRFQRKYYAELLSELMS